MAKTNDYRKSVAETFANILQEKQLDWKKGWQSLGAPANAVTNRAYNNGNHFYLRLVSMMRGYQDNRWATFKQIEEKGWKLKDAKGMGVKVEYWFPYDKKEKKYISWDKLSELQREDDYDPKRFSISARYFTVFNGDHIEGIPERTLEVNEKIKPADIIPVISENMGVPIINDGGDRAFYSPSTDDIHVPQPKFFNSDYDYNCTVLHELSHATGAGKRLNRDQSGRFGSEKYAFEELVAEISSAFMSEHLDISVSDEHIMNHKAYVQSWINAIKEKPEALFKAIKDANQAANYLEYHAELISEKDYMKLMSESKEIDSDTQELIEEKIENMTLEDRYAKAMELAGYEKIEVEPGSLATVGFQHIKTGEKILCDGWGLVGWELEKLQPLDTEKKEEYDNLIHPQGRIEYYTKNLEGDGNEIITKYPDFESAINAYENAGVKDGKQVGFMVGGKEYQFASFDTVRMYNDFIKNHMHHIHVSWMNYQKKLL